MSMPSDKIREKNTELVNHLMNDHGINSRLFSSATNDISKIVEPKNGVKLKSNRHEFGSGIYHNPFKTKMSLK